jgi:hypothetical protein
VPGLAQSFPGGGEEKDANPGPAVRPSVVADGVLRAQRKSGRWERPL